MHSNDYNKIYKDLSTFSNKDLHTLFDYYHVSSISQLVPKLYSKASFPSGTVFDAIKNNNFNGFMEFLNSPTFDPNIRDSKGYTILMRSVMNTKKNGEKYIVELLKKNPDLNIQNNKGWTALMLASLYSNTKSTEETVKILVDAGANLNIQENDGWTALMFASRNSRKDSTEGTVKILVTAAADLNIQDNNGSTALMLASQNTNTDSTEETVKILINAGANLNIQDNNGNTALMIASRYSNEDSTEETVKILVNAGANLNIQDNDDWTALMVASANSSEDSTEETVKILVKAGADLNLKNNDGNTALMLASQYYNKGSTEKTVKILINAGADVNIKNNGETAIELTNNIDIQLLLLEHGAKLTDSQNLKTLVKIKITELKVQLKKYKERLNKLELDLLKCNEKGSGTKKIDNLEECIKKAKEIKRYRPGEGGALKIKEKYTNHPYFTKK